MNEGISLKEGDNNLDDFQVLSKKQEEIQRKIENLKVQLESITNSQSDLVIMAQQKNNQEKMISIGGEISKLNREKEAIDNELLELIELREHKKIIQ